MGSCWLVVDAWLQLQIRWQVHLRIVGVASIRMTLDIHHFSFKEM